MTRSANYKQKGLDIIYVVVKSPEVDGKARHEDAVVN